MSVQCPTACGDCCKQEYSDLYIYYNLTKEQKAQVYLKPTKEQCCQLTDEGKCRIQLLLGFEAKCKQCQEYLCEKAKG